MQTIYSMCTKSKTKQTKMLKKSKYRNFVRLLAVLDCNPQAIVFKSLSLA